MKSIVWGSGVAILTAACATLATAQEALPAKPRLLNPQTINPPTTTLRVNAETLPSPQAVNPQAVNPQAISSQAVTQSHRHPLEPALQFALKAYQHAQNSVRDYSCYLIKRERIDGDLLDMQYIQAKVRTEIVQDGRIVQPYSAYLEFQGPAKIKGRKVLYVHGRNDNKMLVRNGGKRFNFVTVKVDPNGDAALRESLVPITGIGFASVTDSLITLIRQDIQRDPLGANTKVKFFRRAKINGRVCTRISVLHPNPDPVLEFAEANVFVDDELHVPIRVEALLWPRNPGETKPLLFEYTYTELQLNVGLTDDDFRNSLMERSR